MTAGPEAAALPAVLEARGAIALDVRPDHPTGLVAILPRAWPWLRVLLAPEVALMLAAELVSTVRQLCARRP